MKPTVLVDVDGVLADFVAPILDYVFHRTGERLTHDDVTTYGIFDGPSVRSRLFGFPWIGREAFRYMTEPGRCAEIPPIDGAWAGLAGLSNVATVRIVTTPLEGSATWHGEREAWLHRHFGVPARDVTFTHHKDQVRGDFFVDDKPEVVAAWQAAHPHGRAFLWSAPHNRNHEPRLSCWKTLTEQVRQWAR